MVGETNKITHTVLFPSKDFKTAVVVGGDYSRWLVRLTRYTHGPLAFDRLQDGCGGGWDYSRRMLRLTRYTHGSLALEIRQDGCGGGWD